MSQEFVKVILPNGQKIIVPKTSALVQAYDTEQLSEEEQKEMQVQVQAVGVAGADFLEAENKTLKQDALAYQKDIEKYKELISDLKIEIKNLKAAQRSAEKN